MRSLRVLAVRNLRVRSARILLTVVNRSLRKREQAPSQWRLMKSDRTTLESLSKMAGRG